MICFAIGQLEQFQPQNDDKEFLELAIIFLGGLLMHGIHFRISTRLQSYVDGKDHVCHENLDI